MTEVGAAGGPQGESIGRHASWAELFFDLVAIAGVAALAHVLAADLNPAALGLYSLLFLSFWVSWTTFMLYGNVAAGQTRVLRILVGMFGLGLMAASVSGVAHTVLEHGEDARPLTVFAIAYIATRIYGAQSWRRGDVLVDFPVVQSSVGLWPWFLSLFVDEPWKLALWALGVGSDLLLILLISGNRLLERIQAYASGKVPTARRGRARTYRGNGEGLAVRGIAVDPAHLSERLGLFVIIVLGESVIQVIDAAGEVHYDLGLLVTAVASFAMLAGMFGLSVVFGHAGLPHLRPNRISTRSALGLHCLVSGVIATIAVSLALVIEDDSAPLPDAGRWLLCGAVAAYFALGVLTGIASHSSDLSRTISRIVTGIAIPLAFGLLATDVSGRTIVIFLAVIILAHLYYERRIAADPSPGGPLSPTTA